MSIRRRRNKNHNADEEDDDHDKSENQHENKDKKTCAWLHSLGLLSRPPALGALFAKLLLVALAMYVNVAAVFMFPSAHSCRHLPHQNAKGSGP